MEVFPGSWARLSAMESPLLELVVRGTLLYVAVIVLMRFMPRRLGGELAMMDLIFLLLIAEAAAHAMGDYTSVADGVVVIATLIGWAYLLNLLSYHGWFPRPRCKSCATAGSCGGTCGASTSLRRNPWRICARKALTT